MKLAVLMALMLALLSGAGSAGAHEMSMAELEIHETARGDFRWQWGITERRPPSEVLTPRWPEACTVDQSVLHCGAAGLKGPFSIRGIGQAYSAALVKIVWLDGQTSVFTLTGGQPSVQLFGSAEDRRSVFDIASAYTVLGIEHILNGTDHMLFVLALLFLVGFTRNLLWTITAFTLAHSLTLASAALGLLTLRAAPVEANIALSIVLVVAEALNPRLTLARRWPALVAFLFGLVHGLGFAGALKSVGLPANYIPAALLTFNVGVELGNLMVVAAAWPLYRVAAGWPSASRWRRPLLYGIGTVAAYWSWLRVFAILAR
jgi:hydrogenase/urease accessory protein HupE